MEAGTRTRRSLCLLLAAAISIRAAAGEVAAVVSGRTTIPLDEIDATIAPRLAKLAADEDDVRRAVLRELIDAKLLATEASRRGVSVEQLLAAEVTAKAIPRSEFLSALANKAGVRVLLKPLRAKIDTEGRPAVGAANAPVTIVVFSDFECPFCREAAQLLHDVQRLESEDVRLVFRHLPLAIHAHAQRAAEAAECAAQQGTFWTFHDALFRHQKQLSDPELLSYAVSAGAEREAFRQCLERGAARAIIDADRRAALLAGVDGTPAIFINGRRFTGPRSVERLRRVIAEEKPAKPKE